MRNPADRSPYVRDERGVWRDKETGKPALCRGYRPMPGGFKRPCSKPMGHKGKCG